MLVHMGNPETPLQHDMFSGELVDTRTRKQKQADKQAEQPHQPMMFSQREIAQFGVKARPLFSLSPHMKLPLLSYDPRTEEEIDQDQKRQAQRNTVPLFPEPAPKPPPYTVAATPLGTKLRRYPVGRSPQAVVIFSSDLRVRQEKKQRVTA
jgi:hypothetical protein